MVLIPIISIFGKKKYTASLAGGWFEPVNDDYNKVRQ
jgi:hypothetical protein